MNIFTEHPYRNGETYFQHMKKALSFAGIFLFLTFTSVTHALLPFLFITTGSDMIKRLHINMRERTR
jgi:hypothetical protein|tara:strand:- start:2265 stop:2465 length:201 start_codon:yes stop_codon:yes gene_type:complete